jgi:nitrogen fixation/metabolism regulation signal transduction histidine kinase
MTTAQATAGGPVRHKRKLRNYLLDRSFQLKYAGYLFGVAALLSAVLGFLLWNTSRSLIDQSNKTVEQSEQVVALGRKVADESRKVSAVVQMNLVKEYGDNPELVEAFRGENADIEGRLTDQHKALEAQAAVLGEQSASIAAQQRTMLTSLFALLLLLVVGVGLAGIVVTHKVAGPIYKMKRQINILKDGNWRMPDPLRKGDELTEFFGAFRDMVKSFREHQVEEIERLDAVIADLRERVGDEPLEPLEKLRGEMQARLET